MAQSHNTTAGSTTATTYQHSNRATRAVVVTGATLLVTASALLGAYFGYNIGAHYHWLLGSVFALAAFGGEAIKPFAVAASFDAFSRWRIGRGTALALLATVCIAYNVTAELSLTAGTRGDLAAERAAQSTRTKVARDQYEIAKLQLSRVPAPSATSPAKMKGELANLLVIRGVACHAKGTVEFGPISREYCPRIEALEAEIVFSIRTNERRSGLERELREASAAMKNAGATKKPDPLASALAVYTTALGFGASAEELAPWLYLIPVLFLELGSALAFVLVRSFETGRVGQVGQAVGGQPTTVPAICPKLQETLVAQGGSEPTHSDDPDDSDDDSVGRRGVLGAIRENGGSVHGSQRGLAALIGVSRTTLRRVMRELSDEGLVRVTCNRGVGTRIDLMGAGAGAAAMA